MQKFSGFSDQCIPFLQQLAQHNTKEWFESNKQGYESLIREPALALIEAVDAGLREMSPHFRGIAKKSGGSLMRVYRDTRFSRDKTPYKTNIGIQFRHILGKDVHAPGFYLHIEPDNCFLGVGIWHPDGQTLNKIRDFIMDNPAAWTRAVYHPEFRASYQLVGDSLQRPPRGCPADHELIEDLKRKDFIACKNFPCSEISQPLLPQFVLDSYRLTDGFMRYLCQALDLNY